MPEIAEENVVERPWEREPDEKFWIDSETGLPCFIKRHPRMKHLCGYVGVFEDHPKFQSSYDDVNDDVVVYGGCTWSSFDAGTEKADGVWWFGFDCAHGLLDLIPGIDKLLPKSTLPGTYRDMEFVTKECEDLAEQLIRNY